MSDPRPEFVKWETAMSAAFDDNEEAGHIEGDKLLCELIDRLLGSIPRQVLSIEEAHLIRRGLALYDGMPKWYA